MDTCDGTCRVMPEHGCMNTSLLTIEECADVLRVSQRTISRYVTSGALPAVRLGERPNSPVRIPSASVAGFLRDARRTRERAVIA